MTHVVVTVELDSKQRVDLALPLNVSNQVLAPALAQALELPEEGNGVYLLSVKSEDGIVRLSPETTLAQAGVLDGFILQLQRREGHPLPMTDISAEAFLQAETGEAFALDKVSTLIGRKDIKRGVLVDIDLTPFDSGKIISRRHAAIEQKEGKFLLTDQGSANGTWLNGERLTLQKAYPLNDGDMIVFGRNGVQVKFNQR